MSRRTLALLAAVILAGLVAWLAWRVRVAATPIKVGVLHSLSGTMAISERAVVDATLMAIAELNDAGGVLGRRVEPLVVDGASDPAVFAREAERLLAVDEVRAIFGCWTSSCRKTVRPLVEAYDGLLVYPLQYEGLEQSPNILYTGPAPNQQLQPAVKWAFDNLGARFFLVGSDYVFPRAAHAILGDQIAALGGEVVGDVYLPLGSVEVEPVIARIAAARPTVLLNTLNGDSNLAFFRALRRAGFGPDVLPTMSFSVTEEELRALQPAGVAGDYAAWHYFQSLPTPANERFVREFRARYGEDRVTSDPIEAAYVGVHLWAQAVEAAGDDAPAEVRAALPDRRVTGPGGEVRVDPATLHTWKTVRIGKIRSDGQFDVVYTSEHLVRPVPFPVYRSRAQWEALLLGLQDGWQGRWSPPPR